MSESSEIKKGCICVVINTEVNPKKVKSKKIKPAPKSPDDEVECSVRYHFFPGIQVHVLEINKDGMVQIETTDVSKVVGWIPINRLRNIKQT